MEMEQKITQRKMLLAHLQKHGKITNAEAYSLYGISQCPARIFGLRQAGHNIKSVSVRGKNRYGKPVTYTEYIYESKGGKINESHQ